MAIADQAIELTVETLPITDAIRILRDLCDRRSLAASRVFGNDIEAKLRRMVSVRVDNLGGGRARAYIEPSEYLWGIVHALEALPDEPPTPQRREHPCSACGARPLVMAAWLLRPGVALHLCDACERAAAGCSFQQGSSEG